MITNFIYIVLAYLIGSLSSAIIVCKSWGLSDPRKSGSKNPGATNVLRIGGKLPAITTMLGDGLKGFVPTLLASHYLHSEWIIGSIMLAAFLGHIFPIFFSFKGGKGVATAIGCYLGLSLPFGLCVLAVWIGTIAITRISSLGAIFSALAAPMIGWLVFHNIVILDVMLIISAVLLWRHKDNLQRLWAGKEKRISNASSRTGK